MRQHAVSDGGLRDSIDDLPLSPHPRRRIPPAWIPAIISGAFSLASVAAFFWTANEAHRGTELQAEGAALERQVALVESCVEATPKLFALGDDFDVLTGSDGNDEYWNSTDADAFNENRPKKPRVFLRCQFTNLSRVPLLSIYVYFRLGYHHNKTIKESHSFPFALAPNATHALWFFNTEAPTVVVNTPYRARYVRFPDLAGAQSQPFAPRVRDYWIMYRDFDPDEHLDESMM